MSPQERFQGLGEDSAARGFAQHAVELEVGFAALVNARVIARGELFRNHATPWTYLVSFEYRGFDTDPDHDWNFTDISVTAPAGPLGKLTLGKMKESFVYEMVGDAANLPHMERLLSPFFVSRSWGLRRLDPRFEIACGIAGNASKRRSSAKLPAWELPRRCSLRSAKNVRLLCTWHMIHPALPWRRPQHKTATHSWSARPSPPALAGAWWRAWRPPK